MTLAADWRALKSTLNLVSVPRKSLAALLISQTGAAILPMLQVIFLKLVIDSLSSHKSTGQLACLLLANLLVGLGGVWARFYTQKLGGAIGYAAICTMQTRMFNAIIRMPVLFFTTVRSGALVSRITNDVNGTETVFTTIIPTVISSIVTISFAVIVVGVIDFRMLVLLLLVPACLLFVRRAEDRINRLIEVSFGIAREMSSSIEKVLSKDGIVLTRCSGRSAHEERLFADLASEAGQTSTKSAVWAASAGASYGTAFTLMTFGALSISAWLARQGELPIGTLILVVLYIQQLQAPVQALLGTRYPKMRSRIAFERVQAVVDTKIQVSRPQRKQIDAAVKFSGSSQALKMCHVSYTYPQVESYSIGSLSYSGDALFIPGLPLALMSRNNPAGGERSRQVLRDISFSIGEGEIVAMVGHSGAGKTTLASLVIGLLTPDTGTVLVENKDVVTMDEAEMAQAVSFIGQDCHVLHDSVRNNLLYVNPAATEDEMRAACKLARFDAVLATMTYELDTIIGEKGHRLSAGERQRLALARTLLTSPKLVILDEPTAHLDGETAAAIHTALFESRNHRGILVIAHHISTVSIADRIVVLDNGSIAEMGTHDELVARDGIYTKLFPVQRGRR